MKHAWISEHRDSFDVTVMCEVLGVSRSGDCYDNAVAERFFWSLKHEWTNHREFANLEEARLSVFNYIETFYNPKRRHQTLGYKSPNQFEAENAPAQAAKNAAQRCPKVLGYRTLRREANVSF